MANKIILKSSFAAWLRAEIDRSGLSVNAWAAARNLQQSQVSRILTGVRQPSDAFARSVGWVACYRKAEDWEPLHRPRDEEN